MEPIATDDWSADRLDAHLAEVRQVFADGLREDQRPLPEAVSA